MALTDVAKNEMLKGIKAVLTDIQLKYQDGTTGTATTETNLWSTTPALGVLDQDDIVQFVIDTSGGTKNISGFNLIFTSGSVLGISSNFTQIFNYPNDGTFTFDGMSIIVN